MNRAGLYSFLSSAVGVEIFADYKPEDADLPVITYGHISNTRNRVKSGATSGKKDTWRLTIYAQDRQEIDDILGQIEILDNQSSADFSSVYILSTNDDNEAEGDPFVTTFIDIETTDR